MLENISQINVTKCETLNIIVRLLCSFISVSRSHRPVAPLPKGCSFKLPFWDKSSLLPNMFSEALLGAVSLASMVSTLPARATQVTLVMGWGGGREGAGTGWRRKVCAYVSVHAAYQFEHCRWSGRAHHRCPCCERSSAPRTAERRWCHPPQNLPSSECLCEKMS